MNRRKILLVIKAIKDRIYISIMKTTNVDFGALSQFWCSLLGKFVMVG